ncbi:MAG TPA: DUF4236 domain-containing protein [Candidatus Brocadiia bacterium]|nr:DUF4236 domain-containing protein [Candidatus Brocadiia bacterium]
MGWTYRKSVNFGPLRINLSKSGVGYSVGGKGYRTGKTAKGRNYTSISIPGTGLRYYKSGSKQTQPVQPVGCIFALLFLFGTAIVSTCTLYMAL